MWINQILVAFLILAASTECKEIDPPNISEDSGGINNMKTRFRPACIAALLLAVVLSLSVCASAATEYDAEPGKAF